MGQFSRLEVIVLTGSFLMSLGNLFAQVPSIQDCLGAIPICQEVYSETQLPNGSGNYPNEVNPGLSCTDGEVQAIWYTFTVNEDGNFGFLLTPNNPIDDYDWALFNLTNATCEDIYTNASLVVSCNAAGGGSCNGLTGATGGSTFAIQGAGCNFFPPDYNFGYSPYNALIPVETGNTYVLMVSNWSNSGFGYTIDFGISDVSIFDTQGPLLEASTFPESCASNEIQLLFNENIQCNTLHSANITLAGPGGPYTLVLVGPNCQAGGAYETHFSLFTDPPLSESGNYILSITPNPTYPILDNCENPFLPDTLLFTSTLLEPPLLSLPSDTQLCQGSTLTLDVTAPEASYIWQDGTNDSIYYISEPGLYSVTVANDCGIATATTIVTIVQTPPLIELPEKVLLCPDSLVILEINAPLSTYLWQNGTTEPTFPISDPGIFSVTVTNACGAETDTIEAIAIPSLLTPFPLDSTPCSDARPLLLDAGQPFTSLLWQDSSTSNLFAVEFDGLYSVLRDNGCESRLDSIEVTFLPTDFPFPDQDTILCPGDSLVVDYSLIGSRYTWQDDTEEPVYTIREPGVYRVKITNSCGLFERQVLVKTVPALELDLGPDQPLCNDVILLNENFTEEATYRWQNGSRFPIFRASRPGWYMVEGKTACETRSDSILLTSCDSCETYIPNSFTPDGSGYNDNFQVFTSCPVTAFSLEIFNRWGNLVFHSMDPMQGWDGSYQSIPVDPGVYIWRLSCTFQESYQATIIEKVGTLSVIR